MCSWDIGKHFPDTDNRFSGISSIILLEETGKLLLKSGYAINNIDATIIAQKPKMLPHIENMRKNISIALNIDINKINIKATTEEGLGFTGEMLGISSQSISSVESINF